MERCNRAKFPLPAAIYRGRAAQRCSCVFSSTLRPKLGTRPKLPPYARAAIGRRSCENRAPPPQPIFCTTHDASNGGISFSRVLGRLIRQGFHGSIWASQTANAFPHLVNGDDMMDVSRTGTAIQDLRNRIFHQEPLIGHNLSQDYGDILKMLGWICPETREWVRSHSSVPKVIRERPRR